MTNINGVCKRAMLDYMKAYPALALGRFKDSCCNSKANMNALKEDLAAELNAVSDEHMHKNGQQALKMWKDWILVVKRQAAKQKAYARGTGGGEPLYVHFESIDEELLEFLGPDACGMSGIEEGGFPSSKCPSGNRCGAKKKIIRTRTNCKLKNAMLTSGSYHSVNSPNHVASSINIRRHILQLQNAVELPNDTPVNYIGPTGSEVDESRIFEMPGDDLRMGGTSADV